MTILFSKLINKIMKTVVYIECMKYFDSIIYASRYHKILFLVSLSIFTLSSHFALAKFGLTYFINISIGLIKTVDFILYLKYFTK